MRRLVDIARPLAATLLVALAITAAASAATPPTAITGPVTATAATTVTLTGTVNPNGTATTWQFEYGKTTTYGSTTTSQSAGSGSVNTGVSTDVTGLTPGTQYHYRLVATSSTAGTTDGADGIFTTSAASIAPAVTTNAATSITSGGATLNGSLNPNGQATTYDFEYGKTTSYGSTTGAQNGGSGTTSVDLSAAITGLTAGTTYHFRLVATGTSGEIDGADMTFTAGGTSTAGPVATTKAATSVTSTGAKLNGTVNPNGQATTYFFDYGTTTSYGSKTAVASAGSGTKAVTEAVTLTGLKSGTYHFRIEATSPAGTSVGADMTFATTGPPTVQTGTAQGASTTGATLTGTVNPNSNATNWYFQYGTTTGYGSQTPSKSAGSGTAATGVSAVVSKLVAGTTYHYRLVATSSAGTTYGSDVTFTSVSAVTIASSTVQVVYGSQATLSGAVASRQSGVTVSILAQAQAQAHAQGSSSLTSVGTAKTGAGGSWTFKVKPKVETSYKASTPDGLSAPVGIGVRPSITLRVITGKRFTSRVVASKSFKGKTVQLQRLLPGNRWQTLAKARLNANSSAIFSAAKLPRGTSNIRIAMSVNQAGAGYLGAFSRTLTYRR
jgi:hypothetical protein